MTVYVDTLKTHPGGNAYCKLFGTDLVELDEFANLKLNLPRSRRQFVRHSFYVLWPSKRKEAIKRGAIEMSTEDLECRLTHSRPNEPGQP